MGSRVHPGSELLPVTEFGPYDLLSDWAYTLYHAGDLRQTIQTCLDALAWCDAVGDLRTARYLLFIAGNAHQELAEEASAVAITGQLLERISDGEQPVAGVEASWRAKALALLADIHIGAGRYGEAMTVLAEALSIVAVPGNSYNHLSATVTVAMAFRSMLLFEHCDELFVSAQRSKWIGPANLDSIIRNSCVTRLLWGYLLELTGNDVGARQQFLEALSRAARLTAWAREQTNAPVAAWASLMEGAALQRMGEVELAEARIRPALATPHARPEFPETRAARLALALIEADRGNLAAARAELASVRDARCSEDRELWQTLELATRATVESVGAPGPAVDAWQSLSRMTMRRLWRDRAGRFEALADRNRVRTLTKVAEHASAQIITDPLTGLGNRRQLQQLLEREEQPGAPVGLGRTVVFVDVDDFKYVNDRLSHEVGDRVLARLGMLLAAQCRRGDIAMRFGGDEFVVALAVGGTAAAGEALALRLLTAVRQEDWSSIHPELRIRVSAGMSTGETLRTALDGADAAMLRAKRAGRDRLGMA